MAKQPVNTPARGRSSHAPDCTCTRCVGFQPGNTLPVTHGARSEAVLTPLVADLKEALLERMGLHAAELSWIAAELLDAYCRSRAKTDAIDAWLENGNPLIREDGSNPDVMRFYVACTNTRLRALAALFRAVEAMSSAERDLAGALAALDVERSTR